MEPVLKSLTLEKFRGIEDLDLQGLAPVTLLFGSNNSGKTSVLEAAGLILRPFDPGQWITTARQRDLNLPLPDGLWSLFPGGAVPTYEEGPPTSALLKIRASLAGSHGHESRQLEADATTTLEYSSNEAGAEFIRIRAKVDETTHEMAFRPNQSAVLVKSKWLYRVYSVTPATHRQVHLLVGHLGDAVQQGKKRFAIEIMQIFDPLIQDIDTVSTFGRETICVTHKERGIVDLSSFGDGMRRAVAMALAIARAGSGVVLIDEIEAGIHAHALEGVFANLLRMAHETNVQIIATTHSLEAIDAIIDVASEVGSPLSVAGFYIKKRDQGYLCQRFDLEGMAQFREGGRDLR